MNAPAITKAQVLATLAAALAFLAAFGLSLSKDQQEAITNFVTVAYPLVLVADAWIRGKRAQAIGNGARVQGEKLLP